MIFKFLCFISFCLIVNGATPDINVGAEDGALKNSPCLYDDGTLGECVLYYLCDEKGEIIIDGATILDSRFGESDNKNLNCTTKSYVCCKYPAADTLSNNTNNSLNGKIDDISSSTTSSATTPSTKTSSPTKPSTGISSTNTSSVPIPDKCGYRSFSDNSNSDDKEAKFGELPWMVAILKESPDNSEDFKYTCGGSLIHPKAVLTAAHCFNSSQDAGKFIIRVGEWNTKSEDEVLPYQQKKVIKIVQHEDFYRGPLFHDLAVLILESPVNLADNVAVVCLPNEGDADLVGDRCLSSGWGKDNYGKTGVYSSILKKVELPIIENKACENSLRKTRLGVRFILHRSFTCAGGEGLDVCSGDGGSPLVCLNNEKRFTQYGIVSWGIGCGENGIPGVFAKTANYKEWIEEQLYFNDLTSFPS